MAQQHDRAEVQAAQGGDQCIGIVTDRGQVARQVRQPEARRVQADGAQAMCGETRVGRQEHLRGTGALVQQHQGRPLAGLAVVNLAEGAIDIALANSLCHERLPRTVSESG